MNICLVKLTAASRSFACDNTGFLFLKNKKPSKDDQTPKCTYVMTERGNCYFQMHIRN